MPSLDGRLRPSVTPTLGPMDIVAGGLVAIGDDVKCGARHGPTDCGALRRGHGRRRGRTSTTRWCGATASRPRPRRSRTSTSPARSRRPRPRVPLELLEAINLVGPEGYVKERIAEFREAGVTVLNIAPIASPDRATQDRRAAQDLDVISRGRARSSASLDDEATDELAGGHQLVDRADALAGRHELPVRVDARLTSRRRRGGWPRPPSTSGPGRERQRRSAATPRSPWVYVGCAARGTSCRCRRGSRACRPRAARGFAPCSPGPHGLGRGDEARADPDAVGPEG